MVNSELDPAESARTMLVVEDDVLVRLLVCDALRDAGLRVVEAANADEALMYLKTDTSVELVFSDVRMPGSLDGIGLAKRLKLDFPQIKIVLPLDICSQARWRRECSFLPSPIRSRNLADRLVAILEERNLTQ
jgi:CheY-like chemotaxis protein